MDNNNLGAAPISSLESYIEAEAKANDIATLAKEADDAIFENKRKNLEALRQLELKQLAAYHTAAQQAEAKAFKKAKTKAAKQNRELTEQEIKAIKEKYKIATELDKKFIAETKKRASQLQKEERLKEAREAEKEQRDLLFGKGHTLSTRWEGLKSLTTAYNAKGNRSFNLKMALTSATNALSSFAQQLDKQVEEIARNRSLIDTKLHGSKATMRFGSYWEQMSADITGIAGVSPFVKQETIVSNLNNLVNRGISFNVTQRAFLESIKDKIANTFNVADSTLLRLVRIQQQDSSASRLGMEAALNEFLNNMYETTEYMGGIMDSIKGSLEEAMSLMGTEEAVSFEYQVQKWMGSLYSVGMSQQAISGIAGALGKLASGDIEGLMGSGVGNLLVMAANNSTKSIADILSSGLTDSETNNLLQSVVEYLAQIYKDSADSRLVQQQIARVYGVTASDLKAASNLVSTANNTIAAISENNLSYQGGLDKLTQMADSLVMRTSGGEMMSNVLENFKYSMSAGLANDPITYSIYKMASILENVTGGLPIPAVSVLGNMVDLHTSVADLMRAGALSSSILKGLGSIIGGGGGGMSVKASLQSLGIDNISTVQRGGIQAPISNRQIISRGISESGALSTAGNANVSDIQASTMAGASSDINNQLAQAKESEDAEISNNVIDEHIVNIFNLLQNVVSGADSLSVKLAYDGNWNR